MQDFVAIDFETANGRRSSVCSVGIVVVRGGEIVNKFYSLIQPTPNYYTYWTTEVHGLTRRDTDGQPTFPEVWAQIKPLIQGLPLVAHNRPFDESCLKAAFAEYGMTYPDYEFYCTIISAAEHSSCFWRVHLLFGILHCGLKYNGVLPGSDSARNNSAE